MMGRLIKGAETSPGRKCAIAPRHVMIVEQAFLGVTVRMVNGDVYLVDDTFEATCNLVGAVGNS